MSEIAQQLFNAAEVLDDATFERVRWLIRERAGISLAPGKRAMVVGRLLRRVRDFGHPDIRCFVEAAVRDGSAESEAFVNALTTNLTSFFREAHHFPVLVDHLRKRLVAQPSAKVWSAGCASGEEPYSVAMAAVEAFGARPPISVRASDIDTEMLAAGRRAVFPLERIDGVSESRVRRFFLRGVRSNEGSVRLMPELRSLVDFAWQNLADRWPDAERCDAILCRNVLIYFDEQTRAEVLQRLHAALKPAGLLFVGHSESCAEKRELFAHIGMTVYRRIG
ncbi:MAG: methyltransferase domain-containing protein [Burkholderiaceae bacterium]|nr:methyltransferase domain-containing protein [Burkholderiaceae bacterium]